jgi:inner membrane protein
VPTILSHPAIPLAVGLGLGSSLVSRRLLLAGMAAAIVPDLDVYLAEMTSSIGHRGVTHTILFALTGGAFAAVLAKAFDTRRAAAFWFVALSTLSHPLLDMFTNGGGGIPLFWPITAERLFMPFRPIEVSPLGIAPFFSARGVEVILSELRWVWLPAVVVAVATSLLRKALEARHTTARSLR